MVAAGLTPGERAKATSHGFKERTITMKKPIGIKPASSAFFMVLTMLALAVVASAPAQAGPKKTYVTGVGENYDHVVGRWYGGGADMFVFGRACVADENIDDPRLKGRGTFNYTVNAGAGVFWGTAQIVPDMGDGEWHGYWTGLLFPETRIRLTLAGSGVYEGLVARLNYTPGEAPDTLKIEGYILEAKGEPGDRPFKISACRTEKIDAVKCLELDPESWVPFDPPIEASILRAQIESESGQATHAGRISNSGFALVDPETHGVTGMGIATAANGDELFWVYFGTLDPTGAAAGSVHFCGGTGRFEAAIGGFDVAVEGGPVVCYSGVGTINY